MSYVEPTEVKKVLAAVDSPTDQDWQGTPAELSDEFVSLHIGDAEAQVNATLSDTYKVPFNPVPQLITAITRAIAAYHLDLTYRKSLSYPNNDYPILLRYRWAVDQLQQLRTGKMQLDYGSGSEPDEDGGIYRADSPLFPATTYLAPAKYWRSDY